MHDYVKYPTECRFKSQSDLFAHVQVRAGGYTPSLSVKKGPQKALALRVRSLHHTFDSPTSLLPRAAHPVGAERGDASGDDGGEWRDTEERLIESGARDGIG